MVAEVEGTQVMTALGREAIDRRGERLGLNPAGRHDLRDLVACSQADAEELVIAARVGEYRPQDIARRIPQVDRPAGEAGLGAAVEPIAILVVIDVALDDDSVGLEGADVHDGVDDAGEPRWSVVTPVGIRALLPASMAGLSRSRAMVWVGPP